MVLAVFRSVIVAAAMVAGCGESKTATGGPVAEETAQVVAKDAHVASSSTTLGDASPMLADASALSTQPIGPADELDIASITKGLAEAPMGSILLSPNSDSNDELKAIQAKTSDDLKVIQANASTIRRCYERSLQRMPGLSGKVVVEFVIGIDGVVTKARVKSTSLKHPETERCIVAAIKKLEFSSSEKPRTLTLPLIFQAS